MILAMFADRMGTIWTGSNGGLTRFDPLTEQSKRYTSDKNNPKSLSENIVRSIYETRSGTLWVGTATGLDRYSKASDDFVRYTHDSANPRSVSEGEVLAILDDDNDHLWVGSTGGLNKYNTKMSRFVGFKHEADNKNSISRDEILSIFEDRDNIVWIGTRRSGQRGELNRYDPRKQRFDVVKGARDALVYSIFEDREGIVWFGTFQGLISFNRETGEFTDHTGKPSEVSEPSGNTSLTSVITIKEGRAGQLFFGTIGGGMSIFDRATGTISRFQHMPDNSTSLGANRVYAIHEDRKVQLWIGTGEGLSRFDPQARRLTLYRYDANNPHSISANDIGSIFEDKSGVLWFGSSTGGLNRFDRETDTFSHFTQADGLPSNDIFDIMEDEQGNLWLSTDRGLSRFNIETKSIRTYNVIDGVPNNPFDNKTAFKNRSGEMYFGGQDGFVKFNPADFTDSKFVPPVYLTDIRILEQPAKLEQNVSEIRELSLSWRDYVVSFDFAALDFTDPQKLKYQWKLDGFDPDWISGGTRRTATYTNLPGGDYILKVRATNVDGVWGGEAVNLLVRVQPPFYRTIWFIALAMICIGFVAWRAYKFRIDGLRAAGEAQTRFTQQLINSQEAERKRIAAELHDGLGQSLVIIKNRAMLGLNKSGDPKRVARELSSISDSASQALDEVRDITNNLRPQLLDRLGLTRAIESMLKTFAGVIEIESRIDNIDAMFSEDEEISVYRIIQESVNNAVKHSDAARAVVNVRRDGARLLIAIEDDGKGFDAESVVSGFGLTGLKERAQLLSGELTIKSRPGEGTKISMSIWRGRQR